MANRLIQLTCLLSCMAYCVPSWGQYGPPGPQMQYTQPHSLQHPNWMSDPLHCQLPLGSGVASGQPPANCDVKPLPYLPGGPVPANYAVPGQRYSTGNGTITHLAAEIGECDPWEEETAFERHLHAVMNNSWVRLDYLNWSVREPGAVAVGHDSYLNILNEEVGSDQFWTYSPEDEHSYLWFPEFYDVTLTGRPVTNSDISLTDNSGIRGTWGIPTTFGEVQISSFLLGQAADIVNSTDGDSSGMWIILYEGNVEEEFPWGETRIDIEYDVPVTLNGEIQQPLISFNNLQSHYSSDVWGADYKLYFDTFMPKKTGLILRPLIGIEYMSIQENMSVIGTRSANDQGFLNVNSFNNLYGGLIGVNLEARHEKFLVGVEPKGLIGFNNYRTRIKTNNFAQSGEGEYVVKKTASEFNAMLDLQVYAKIHCSKNFDLFVGYDLKYAGKVARPATQIEYEVEGTTDAPETAFKVGKQLEQFSIDGLTIGGELRFY